MRPTDDQLRELARLVETTADREIDCAEMLQRVAAYLKALSKNLELSDPLQQAAQHLKICPECKEEFLALIRAEGIDPGPLLEE